MRKFWKNPDNVAALKYYVNQGLTASQIASKLKCTKYQVIGYCWRNQIKINHSKTPAGEIIMPKVLADGSKGVIERIVSDKSRITLKNIPSIAEWQASTAYSYTAQDRTSDK